MMRRVIRRIVGAVSGDSSREPQMHDQPPQTARAGTRRIKTAAEIVAERREADFVELINPYLDSIKFTSVAEAVATLEQMQQEIKIFEAAKVEGDDCILDPQNKITVFAKLKDLFLNADSYVGPVSETNLVADPQQIKELRALIIKRMKSHTAELLKLSKKKLADMIAAQQNLQKEKEAAQKRMLAATNQRQAKLNDTLSAAEKAKMQEYGILASTQPSEARLCIALHRLLREIKSCQVRFKSYAAAYEAKRVDLDDVVNGLRAHVARIKDHYINILAQHLRYSDAKINDARQQTYTIEVISELKSLAELMLECFNGSHMFLAQVQPLKDDVKDLVVQYPDDLTNWFVMPGEDNQGTTVQVRMRSDLRFELVNMTANPEFYFTAELIMYAHRVNIALDWLRSNLTTDDAVSFIELELAGMTQEEQALLVAVSMYSAIKLINKTLHVNLDIPQHRPAEDQDTDFSARFKRLEASTTKPLKYIANVVKLFANQGLTLQLFLQLDAAMRQALVKDPNPALELVRDFGMLQQELLLHKHEFFQQLSDREARRSLKDILTQCAATAKTNTLDPRRREEQVDINQLLRFPEKELLAMLADPEKTIYFPARVKQQTVNEFLSSKIKKLPPAPRLVQS